jgi:hypothetical protein
MATADKPSGTIAGRPPVVPPDNGADSADEQPEYVKPPHYQIVTEGFRPDLVRELKDEIREDHDE